MRVTRRYLAAAGTLALAATSLPGHAESADEVAVRKALDDLFKAMIAAAPGDALSPAHSGRERPQPGDSIRI
jgi:hypothetical protein